MNSYYQFLILLLIIGYFLAKTLDSLGVVYFNSQSIPYLDYILGLVATLIIIFNRTKLLKYLKKSTE